MLLPIKRQFTINTLRKSNAYMIGFKLKSGTKANKDLITALA